MIDGIMLMRRRLPGPIATLTRESPDGTRSDRLNVRRNVAAHHPVVRHRRWPDALRGRRVADRPAGDPAARERVPFNAPPGCRAGRRRLVHVAAVTVAFKASSSTAWRSFSSS
jgi:hypothetical protein